MLSRLLVVLMLFGLAQAQTIGLQLTGAIPAGDFADQAKFGYAVGATIQVPVKSFVATGYVGYGLWDESSNPTASEFSLTNWPIILLGARSYYGDFYLTTLAGVYPVELKIKGGETETVEMATYGAVLAGIGYVFPVSFFDLDISAGYLWNPEYPQFQFGATLLFFR